MDTTRKISPKSKDVIQFNLNVYWYLDKKYNLPDKRIFIPFQRHFLQAYNQQV